MERRPLGRTGVSVSPIGLGCWAIGGTWGSVDDRESEAALHRAIDEGIDLFDTADVYGDGKSERLIAKVLRERPHDEVFVATKAGRRLQPHTAEGYDAANLGAFVERSLRNLQRERIDLLQLHCPPPEVYRRPETFAALDGLVAAGKVRSYGVSVETVEEALAAIEHPGVQTIQIIFNVFRLRPARELLGVAAARGVGILARVPLASGLLTGKMRPDTRFEADDHRDFNREGQAFDVGETFSGVPYALGLELVEALRAEVPPGATMAQWALRWILMHEGVTCAIPGAKRPAQVSDNAAAMRLAPLADESMARVESLYDARLGPLVDHRW
ncbi:aldo/keto reductase [Paraliomyxa miuraensis]|uniref:aldo/keto reductase n=1 Tax=Paraliomyxa miuraensis TaxID=376150 RepID=UPI00225911AA|nr:aldo/keto reductase [Paraliomyxa miuraensis]MCX4241361.1 aldo/keto reductase [Paraliomyxa miuraensis]